MIDTSGLFLEEAQGKKVIKFVEQNHFQNVAWDQVGKIELNDEAMFLITYLDDDHYGVIRKLKRLCDRLYEKSHWRVPWWGDQGVKIYKKNQYEFSHLGLAPSGSNLQPLELIIISNSELVNKVFPLLKWAGYIDPAGNPPEGKRPMAYIIVLINTEIRSQGGEVDAAAAIENMLLTALEGGVGSCWLGSIDRDQLRSMFEIPKRYRIDSVIALGYPDESPVLEEVTDSIKYWKDEQGVLHVPKRKLSDIMHYNKF